MAAMDDTTMNPSDHNVEDVIRGVRAIARALRTTPAQVHELRERQGLPTFLSGRTLCVRWNDLAAWLAAQRGVAEAPGTFLGPAPFGMHRRTRFVLLLGRQPRKRLSAALRG